MEIFLNVTGLDVLTHFGCNLKDSDSFGHFDTFSSFRQLCHFNQPNSFRPLLQFWQFMAPFCHYHSFWQLDSFWHLGSFWRFWQILNFCQFCQQLAFLPLRGEENNLLRLKLKVDAMLFQVRIKFQIYSSITSIWIILLKTQAAVWYSKYFFLLHKCQNKCKETTCTFGFVTAYDFINY